MKNRLKLKIKLQKYKKMTVIYNFFKSRKLYFTSQYKNYQKCDLKYLYQHRILQ